MKSFGSDNHSGIHPSILEAIARLLGKYCFYIWHENRDQVRWMTSFDTTPAEVEAFVADIRVALE